MLESNQLGCKCDTERVDGMVHVEYGVMRPRCVMYHHAMWNVVVIICGGGGV